VGFLLGLVSPPMHIIGGGIVREQVGIGGLFGKLSPGKKFFWKCHMFSCNFGADGWGRIFFRRNEKLNA